MCCGGRTCTTILRFNDFHMEQFCQVCWKEGRLFQFFLRLPTKWALSCVQTWTSHLQLKKLESFFLARALHTCHSSVWQNGRFSQKNQKVEGALWGRKYFPWLLQCRDDCTVCWGPKQKFTGSTHIGPIIKVMSAKSGEMQTFLIRLKICAA